MKDILVWNSVTGITKFLNYKTPTRREIIFRYKLKFVVTYVKIFFCILVYC